MARILAREVDLLVVASDGSRQQIHFGPAMLKNGCLLATCSSQNRTRAEADFTVIRIRF
jgi:hypothetical protein